MLKLNVVQVGYVAERVAATPASGRKPVVHRCEVLAAAHGSGPLFRCDCIFRHLCHASAS
jgi:hypothetical protein